MKRLLFLAACSVQAETICGRSYETQDLHQVLIFCIPAMGKEPAYTQVFIRPKFGRAAEIELGDQYYLIRLNRQDWAGAAFAGEFAELPKITLLVEGRS